MGRYEEIFTPACLEAVFPSGERTSAFFDALFGDAEEGAYDIRLSFQRAREEAPEQLVFFFELHQRNGMAERAGWKDGEWTWELGSTEEVSNKLHVIPLTLKR